jgi:putative GTP pyrophosphokinase
MAGYSKRRVDRAGRFFAEQLRASGDGRRRVGEDREDIEEAVQVIDWWRSEHVRPLAAVSANLSRYVSEEADPVVAQRLKRVPTIAAKLLRKNSMRLSQMEDVGGVRAVLPDQQAVYRVARRLKENWTIKNSHDYVAGPKADGYRALHLVNQNRGRLIEIQLRTPLQDLWANAVEGAAQRFPGFKTGGGPVELRKFFGATSEVFAGLDEGELVKVSASRLAEVEDLLDRANRYLRDTNDP